MGNNEFANIINSYDETKSIEFFELKSQLEKLSEDITKKDAMVVELREQNLSSEKTAVNRKEMCYKNEADILVLESRIKDYKQETENLQEKIQKNNDSFLELLKQKDYLELTLKNSEELNLKNDKKIQILEDNLKFYKDHYEEI